MEAAYHRVHSQLFLQQCQQKNLYDRKVAGAPYCVGDLVWLHSPEVAQGSSRKLHRPWQGPYKFVKVIADVVYRIQQMKQSCRRIVVHYDRLKPYHGQLESSIPVSSETIIPTDQSDPATPSNYEDDEPVVVYPSPPVQTSDEISLRRSSRIRRPPELHALTLPCKAFEQTYNLQARRV